MLRHHSLLAPLARKQNNARHSRRHLWVHNLSAHKVKGIRQAIEDIKAHLLYLPPYSPDLNPIAMFFSKLEALLKKAAERSIDDLWKRIGEILDTTTKLECQNFFCHAGYDQF